MKKVEIEIYKKRMNMKRFYIEPVIGRQTTKDKKKCLD